MAKTQSPLWGLGASGTIGGEVVYARWKGIKYARRRVIPANPRTLEQMKTRSVFTFASSFWSLSGSSVHDPNLAASQGRPLTDRNVFIANNVRSLRGRDNLAGLVISPGANGGYALATLNATGYTGTVSAVATVPALPSGWQVVKTVFVLVPDQDPHEQFSGIIFSAEDNAAPYEVVFEGLEAGTYCLSAYAVYQRADGRVAYGPSSNVLVTVS